MPTRKKPKINKKQKLRNFEYYQFQPILDKLYEESLSCKSFKRLMPLITDTRNIKLAYRNIRKSKGSNTSGTNNRTIIDINQDITDNVIGYIRKRFSNYIPHKVRRVYISKPNGDKRPLGIPTIEDRLLQQCILQILEPICEAKFYKHSYGFRPNRGTQHAIARAMSLTNLSQLHYVVDMDIKGFFDNVNHGKLLKQMWTLGIQDKQLLRIISKLLKAEIEGEGIPTKGTPQGGIISPLLANITLNELDWWLASQWEHFPSDFQYKNKQHKYRALKKTELKTFFHVRYADDFKIYCKDYETAQKLFIATKKWLKERLDLDTSEEKSKIVNLNTNYSEFLGFKMKVKHNGEKMVAQSHMCDKAIDNAVQKIRYYCKLIGKEPLKMHAMRLNSLILGLHNYYKIATQVNKDFKDIYHRVMSVWYKQVGKRGKSQGELTETYRKFYGMYSYKTFFIEGIPIYPIAGIKHRNPMSFQDKINDYTEEGRKFIHTKLTTVDMEIVKHLMNNPSKEQSAEYNDNRIALYVGQNGLCAITKEPLAMGNMHCHHRTPKEIGGSDEYNNLVYLLRDVHLLIHANKLETIQTYLKKLNLEKKELDKINEYRQRVGNCVI